MEGAKPRRAWGGPAGGPEAAPWGSAFLKALPASTKLVAASCLLCSCRWSCAAWQKALPAAAGGGERQARGAAGGGVGMGGVRLRPRPAPARTYRSSSWPF